MISLVLQSRKVPGTGIIVGRDGYILTNRHVIPESVQNVSVVMSDGTEHENVRVVGRDSLNDIAFLKIKDVNDLELPKCIAYCYYFLAYLHF